VKVAACAGISLQQLVTKSSHLQPNFASFFKVRDRKFFRHLDSRTAMMYNKKAPNGAIFDRKDARQ
jgi:hypothetical protein